MNKLIKKLDRYTINQFKELELPVARIAIFIVYTWFGMLKILGVSPATPLIQNMFEKMIGFVQSSDFYPLFPIVEVVIGIIFLLRVLERLAISLLVLHLVATIMPLFFLPDVTWQGFLVPTLEGQYIIKNILIAAAAVVVGSKLVPVK